MRKITNKNTNDKKTIEKPKKREKTKRRERNHVSLAFFYENTIQMAIEKNEKADKIEIIK
jgi:hypothetical protein